VTIGLDLPTGFEDSPRGHGQDDSCDPAHDQVGCGKGYDAGLDGCHISPCGCKGDYDECIPLNGQFAIYTCSNPFANEANKTLLVTTSNQSYVCPFNTPRYSIFNFTEIKLYLHFASDPFVIALGKKNAAILAEQEMLDKAERAGVPAALDCIGIYTKPCHDNDMSAAIPPVSISTVHDSSIPNLCVFG
jgi:hypothetical protein